MKAMALVLSILDTGKALVTIGFVDSLGEVAKLPDGATVASAFTASDPGVTVANHGDGLNADVAIVDPAPVPLPVGVVVTAVTTVTLTDGSALGPFTATASPVDFVAGPIAGTVAAVAAE